MLTEQLTNQHEILQALTRGALVLTGNNRLANTLIDQYDHFCLANKKTVWPSPDIIPINNWLIQSWESAMLSGLVSSDTILLSHEQEYQAWESIIKQSSYGNGLLRISATAKSVSDAWRLLQNWKLSHDDTDYQNSDDAKAFHFWASEFETSCINNNWIVTAQLASLDFYSTLNSSREILLLGFDELNPQLQCLFEKLKSGACDVRWLRQETKGQFVVRLQCNDIRDEIYNFSCWAKKLLEDNTSNRIALVAPDISSIRPILLNTLERVLLPTSSAMQIMPVNASTSEVTMVPALPWDISMGLPLVEYSIIKVAFQLLSLVRGKPSIEMVSSLLRSPHIAGASDEHNQRALLDRQLRELGEPLVSLQTLHYYSGQQHASFYCPEIVNISKNLIKLKKSCLSKAGSQQWTEWLTSWLIAAGWSAGRSISSEEYQTIEAWKALLQSFASLQTVTDKMTFEQAVTCLLRLASDKIFQIQSKSAPIQILGLYESIGLEFDYLWVMNLHGEVWPVVPRPNPFIPMHLQKQFGLPHASWERELVIAKKITKRLELSAANVVFSYPAKNGTQELRVSPLIGHYPQSNLSDLAIEFPVSWQQQIKQQAELEKLTDDVAVAVSVEKVSGGSSIFKNQSLCPFRAFVENRLHAKPMRQSQPGLDAMKRGSLLHAVLELFWNVITDQQQLKSRSPNELELIINDCIEKAIAEMTLKSPDTFNDCFTRIEKQRLLKLMLYWLELELQRAPFKVVDTERELNIDINGINAHLFIDRVDELENGDKMVIDYKTGLVSATDWFGERPNDPQLPLYSMASGDELSAVLFAQIKTGEVKFNGVVEQAGLIPDLPPKRKGALKDASDHWPQVLTDWKTVLNTLANNFLQAHIDVDPKDGLATCRKLYCELSPLCRINELIEHNGSNRNADLQGED